MKRTYLMVVVALLAAGLLGGCSRAAQSATPANAGQLSAVMQLAIGTLKLEGTDQAVDAAQAARLLPLWKAARSLGKSDTTAAAESNGLVKQIQQTMTSEQMQAIQAMALSRESLPSVAQELGIEIGPAGMAGSPPAIPAASGSSGAGGGMPGGGMPPEMGGMPGGPPGSSSSSGSTSQTAKSSAGGSFLGVNSTLLNAVIDLLETRAQ